MQQPPQAAAGGGPKPAQPLSTPAVTEAAPTQACSSYMRSLLPSYEVGANAHDELPAEHCTM